MKYFKLGLVLALLLAFVPGMAMASIGIQVNGNDRGQAAEINFTGPSGTAVSFSGSAVNVPVLSSTLVETGVANGGGTSMVSSDLAVVLGYAYVKKAIASDAAFSQGTLANGTPGQMFTLAITTVAGSGTFTVTPATSFGWTDIVFGKTGQYATFLYLNSTQGWVLMATGAYNINGGNTTLPTVHDANGV